MNTNGVISFLGAVSQYTPAPFSLRDNRRLISPSWGDMDTRNGGTALYRESIDPVLLDRATKDVRRGLIDHKKFSASWIFMTTWDRVVFYGAKGEFKNKLGGKDEFFALSQAWDINALQIADPSSKQDVCHIRTLYRFSSPLNLYGSLHGRTLECGIRRSETRFLLRT